MLLYGGGFSLVVLVKAIPVYMQCTELEGEAYRQCSYPFNAVADIAIVVYGIMLALYLQEEIRKRRSRNTG